jgi:hypothetical protein
MLNFTRLISCLMLLFVASCASTSSPTAAKVPRFREAAATDLVLEYYRWDTIYMTHPDSHENGVYPILTRNNVTTAIKQRDLGRNLAVVIIGFMMSPDVEAKLFHDWESLLADCGYGRVVFLRAGATKKIDGLPIVRESVIASSRADSSKNTASFTAVPSAP